MIFDRMAIAKTIWPRQICHTRHFLQDFLLRPRYTVCAPLLVAFNYSLAYNQRYGAAGFQFPSHLRPLCRLLFCLPIFYRQNGACRSCLRIFENQLVFHQLLIEKLHIFTVTTGIFPRLAYKWHCTWLQLYLYRFNLGGWIVYQIDPPDVMLGNDFPLIVDLVCRESICIHLVYSLVDCSVDFMLHHRHWPNGYSILFIAR